jgi:hypothetical protein
LHAFGRMSCGDRLRPLEPGPLPLDGDCDRLDGFDRTGIGVTMHGRRDRAANMSLFWREFAQ